MLQIFNYFLVSNTDIKTNKSLTLVLAGINMFAFLLIYSIFITQQKGFFLSVKQFLCKINWF